jgi:2Fe-2S ferredoxin
VPVISFAKKHHPPIEVSLGANLMKSLLAAQIPVASSCNGDGVCAKCRIRITKQGENTSPPNETEIFLREKFNLKPQDRISCQTQVLGDLEIDASYW